MKFNFNIFRFLFLYLFLLISTVSPEGFLSKTLVKTPFEFSYIEQLDTNNTVLSYIPDTQQFAFSSITKIIHVPVHSFIKIVIDKPEICCAPDQLFYCYDQSKWIRVDGLALTDFLIDYLGNPIAIESIECVQQNCTFHALALKPHHTYCVSEHNIVVHNMVPAMIVCFSSTPSIAPVAQACIGAALAFFGFHFSKKSNSRRYASDNNDSYSSSYNYGGYYPNPIDPNDPNDKNNKSSDHPHGIYRDAPYHHKNSRPGKSKCPNDGQRCLDYSLPTDSHQRIAIEGKNFVILNRTCIGEYHGYIIEWKNLEPKIQNMLIKEGFVRKSGKIIKQIVEKSLL